MFNLLSNQTKLLKFISNYTEQEVKVVCRNLTLTVELLNASVDDLLANRRTYGVLLPQGDAIRTQNSEEALMLINTQLLLDHKHIIRAINTLCLTEAIMVRDNFINCLEVINEENNEREISLHIKQKSLKNNTQEQSTVTIVVSKKSNVSPIRLTEIKQRLAQAVQTSEDKKEQVKNKLNKLLTDAKAAKRSIVTKQA